MTAELTYSTSNEWKYSAALDGELVAMGATIFHEGVEHYAVAAEVNGTVHPLLVLAGEGEDPIEVATEWVKFLAELIRKARLLDELSAPVQDQDPFKVEFLGDAERDHEWVDRDGDHYKVIDGEWKVRYLRETEWRDLFQDSALLSSYGPYTAVRPELVDELTDSERDRKWESTTDRRRRYRSVDGQWHFTACGNPWDEDLGRGWIVLTEDHQRGNHTVLNDRGPYRAVTVGPTGR